jgi:GntR family transcriptional regulator
MHTIEKSVLNGLTLRRDGVPIYVQIREQFLRAISSGALASGARMPTMRQVAVALKVDLNTVRHAYEDLQREGVITLRRGHGSFVTDAPAPTPIAGDPHVEDLARRVIAQAMDAGVDPHKLATRIAGLITSSGDLKS